MSNKTDLQALNANYEALIEELRGKASSGSSTAQGDIVITIYYGQLTLNKMRLTGSGSAVNMYSGNLTMTDCVFDASAFVENGGTTTLVGCTFLNWGAMRQVGYNFTMTDCVFTDCEVLMGGDYGSDGELNLTFTNCHFNNCSLEYSDAAYAALVAGGNYIDGVLIT